MNTAQKTIALAAATLGAALPLAAFAQIGGTPPSAFSPNLTSLGQVIVNQVWVFFTVIAIIAFVVAGVKFMTSQGDADKIKEARDAFLWGVAGVVVGIIAYTIIALVRGALGA